MDVYYPLNMSQLLVPFLSYMNPFHVLPSYSFKILIIFIFPSTSRSSK